MGRCRRAGPRERRRHSGKQHRRPRSGPPVRERRRRGPPGQGYPRRAFEAPRPRFCFIRPAPPVSLGCGTEVI
ncbi:protein of unknown function [Azospirillum baldaniorum]|uniref:Uncharacterized protein n=1 Tax=Azospirillum baldaniorum TaxID=1064539 RepID=A0A9P1JP51_9PROT|nr:protein of unknown function [Azospirillum baldaniorum]